MIKMIKIDTDNIEESKDIPFDIKRIYYIYKTSPNIERGFHAHKNLKQVLHCVNGSCDIVIDGGRGQNTITLDNKEDGLLIEGLVWREMKNFSLDCVLVVYADNYYNEDDYIRDYTDFINLVKS